MDGTSAAQFVARSPARRRVMAALHETPHRPCKLVDAAATSRRSVQRTLSELTDRGWARKEHGRYRLTTVGSLIFDIHERYTERLDLVGRHESLFRHLPEEHLPEPEWLRGAESSYATAERSQRPTCEYIEWAGERSCDTLRCLAPGHSSLVADAHGELLDGGTDVVQVVEAPSNGDQCPIADRDAFELCVHPDRIEFGLTLAGRCGAIRAYDERTRLCAFVRSTDERLLSWLEERFERYRRESRRVDP
jgi:DNA-binding transcriptional ArsR family regulator